MPRPAPTASTASGRWRHQPTSSRPRPGASAVAEPRTLIPTPRQVALGDRPPDTLTGPPDGSAPPAGRIRQENGEGAGAGDAIASPARMSVWRRALRDADPRRIEGPLKPLVVFGLISLLTQWDDAALGALLPEIRAELGLST